MNGLFGIPTVVFILVGLVFAGAVFGLLFFKDRKKPLTNPANEQAATVTDVADGQKTEGKYRAYYWSEEDGIKIIHLPNPIGSLWVADTTMPVPGACYLVIKDLLGDYQAYDPRENKMVEGERPQRAYDASHCRHLVNNVYASVRGLWDKINMLLPYGAAFLLFIVILVGLDKL